MIKKRYRILILLIIVFLIGSSYRLIDINILKQDTYQQELKIKTNNIIEGNSAPRGRIVDINGNILVDNIGVKTITYTKFNDITIQEELEIAYELADIIALKDTATTNMLQIFWMVLYPEETNNLITSEEYQKLEERKLTNEDIYNLKLERLTEDKLNILTESDKKSALIYYLMNKGYEYEKKTIKSTEVTEKEFAKALESKIKGVTGEISWERVYPYSDTLKPILGTITTESKGLPEEDKEHYLNIGYDLNDRVGISYLEKEYEEYLKGEKNLYKINSDNTLSIYKEGKKGNDLVLSIDIELQEQIDNILKEEIIAGRKLANTEYFNHAYVIISDVTTGNILTMTGEKLNEDQTYTNITSNIISSSYSMGSVVKPASMTLAYQKDLVEIGKSITDSCVKLYLNPPKCSWESLGKVDEISALQWSSNYYQFLLAIKSTGNKYYPNMKLEVNEQHFKDYRDTFSSYGLGTITNIDLPNEKLGVLGSTIAADLLLNYTIGQYDTYTPIQLTQYINTLANGGKRISPSLMSKIYDNQGNIIIENNSEVLNTVNIHNEDLNRIKDGMIQVSSAGTAKGYTNLKYKPAAKTGTSESIIDTNNDGKVDTETISSSYIMYAPHDNPKYSIVVITPNISHKNGKSEYVASINKKISLKVSNILFEKYPTL